MDTGAVVLTKTLLTTKPFSILLCILTSAYSTLGYGGKTKLKRFLSLQGFKTYIDLYSN